MVLSSISNCFAADIKAGEIYRMNVDACVYETVDAAIKANKLAVPQTALEAANEILKTYASVKFQEYEKKKNDLNVKKVETIDLLNNTIKEAKNMVGKITDSKEKIKKTKILNQLSNFIKDKSTVIGKEDCKKVGYGTKFEVLGIPNDLYYVIKITSVYNYVVLKDGESSTDLNVSNHESMRYSEVVENSVYYLNKVHGESGLKVSNLVYDSVSGVTSGPLVVPFKYRTNDKSISGEVAVGYYVGITWEWGREAGVTPIVSAGLSQISVADVTNATDATDSTGEKLKTENRTGFTWAAGFLISNWDGVNIGLIYGQDRLGDPEWEHEGEGWLSLSIGWDI